MNKMNNIYIRNRDEFRRILKFDLKKGPLDEMYLHEDFNVDIEKKASYVNLSGDFWGVFASEEGPILFNNNSLYKLSDKNLKLQHEPSLDSYFFRVYYEGLLVCEKKYNRWQDLDVDPWSDESFVDIFIWISERYNNKDFITLWTI